MPERNENRKFERYDTEVRILFQVAYDIQTKVEYRVINPDQDSASPKYSALSKNISVEGLCFSSVQKLEVGDILSMELYLPAHKDPIPMQGEVRWSEKKSPSQKSDKFDTGVKLMTINGKPVHESIYFDQDNKVVWSLVLESVFGSFRIFAQKQKKA